MAATQGQRRPTRLLDLPQELLDIIYFYAYARESRHPEFVSSFRWKHRETYKRSRDPAYQLRPFAHKVGDFLVSKKFFLGAARIYINSQPVDQNNSNLGCDLSPGIIGAFVKHLVLDGSVYPFLSTRHGYPMVQILEFLPGLSAFEIAEAPFAFEEELTDEQLASTPVFKNFRELDGLLKIRISPGTYFEDGTHSAAMWSANCKKLEQLLQPFVTRPRSAMRLHEFQYQQLPMTPLYNGSSVSLQTSRMGERHYTSTPLAQSSIDEPVVDLDYNPGPTGGFSSVGGRFMKPQGSPLPSDSSHDMASDPVLDSKKFPGISLNLRSKALAQNVKDDLASGLADGGEATLIMRPSEEAAMVYDSLLLSARQPSAGKCQLQDDEIPDTVEGLARIFAYDTRRTFQWVLKAKVRSTGAIQAGGKNNASEPAEARAITYFASANARNQDLEVPNTQSAPLMQAKGAQAKSLPILSSPQRASDGAAHTAGSVAESELHEVVRKMHDRGVQTLEQLTRFSRSMPLVGTHASPLSVLDNAMTGLGLDGVPEQLRQLEQRLEASRRRMEDVKCETFCHLPRTTQAPGSQHPTQSVPDMIQSIEESSGRPARESALTEVKSTMDVSSAEMPSEEAQRMRPWLKLRDLFGTRY